VRNLAELKNKHIGKTCWVFGTGPSLDVIPLGEIAGPRIFINRTAFVLPHSLGESYWFVMDNAWNSKKAGDWDSELKRLHNGKANMVGVFRNPSGKRKNKIKPPKRKNIVYWNASKMENGDVLKYTKDEIVEKNVLFSWSGSCASATHLAWFMGCSTVRYAGIDGTDGFANLVKGQYDTVENGAGGYVLSKKEALRVAKQLNMKVVDYS